MRPRTLAPFAVGFAIGAASAFAAPEPLPEWAQPAWDKLAQQRALERSPRLAPGMLAGDFDGDGKPDLALLVRQRGSGKEGIALLFGAAKESLVVGAGKSFGNGGDDFVWMDTWKLERADKAKRLAADALYVAKSESASALIVLRSGRPVWRQQGD